MAKKSKESDMNLYYLKNDGQAKKETIEDLMQKKKDRERQKRIKQSKEKNEDKFDLETETVIGMTNKNKIKKDEVQKKELSKKQKKKNQKRKRLKLILKIIIFVFIISGSIVFALTSPIFNIKDIQVSGNSQVSSDTVISLSGLTLGQNIFRFWNSNVENAIKENAYIENVKIDRKIPTIVQISIEERVATYSVDYMGKYAYINNQGYILEISEDSKSLPIIQGISTNEEDVVPGNRLNNEDLKRLETVIKIINAAKENELDSKVTSIDISKENDYSIYIQEENKKVHLGDGTNISNKILYVLAIIQQEKGVAGDIYVNGDLNNKFQPYFREKV